jgi:imidazolonepropionase-like amidohydrolase
MVMLVECGYSPVEAIRAATSIAARAIGVDNETGTIAAGKIADLAVFSGNPLKQIKEVSKVHGGGPSWIVRQGRIVLENYESHI